MHIRSRILPWICLLSTLVLALAASAQTVIDTFFIGTGPVRGFAVTLGIGILTTLFTAFTLTRLIVAAWVRWWRPQTVPI